MSVATPETEAMGITTRSGWKLGRVRFQDKANEDGADHTARDETREERLKAVREARLTRERAAHTRALETRMAYCRSVEEVKLEYARKIEEMRTAEISKRLSLKNRRSCWPKLTFFNVSMSTAATYAFVFAYRHGWLDSWFGSSVSWSTHF